MRRLVWSLSAASCLLAMAGCGGGEVAVQAQLESEGGDPTPLENLPVRAIPYDRDVVFDSLETAYAEPQPEIPDSLVQLQEQIATAQSEWQTATTRWNTARDSLKALSDQLRRLSPASAEYRLMFRDFGALESAEATAKRQMDQSFARFTDLQNRFTSQAQEIKAKRDQWADAAYASVDTVIFRRLEALDLEEIVDTTNASGMVRFELPPGEWWIHARYDLPYEELYWNVPVQVQRGEPAEVTLNRATAQRRPKL